MTHLSRDGVEDGSLNTKEGDGRGTRLGLNCTGEWSHHDRAGLGLPAIPISPISAFT